MSDLRCLRDRELAPELAAKLAPFIRAYQWDCYRVEFENSYDRGVRLRELVAEGAEPVVSDGSFSEDFEELYFSSHGYYPEENPNLSET